MAEYYGVQRSKEYLAHYGVKGMRWGVRRAIETGNQEKLNRLYAKAQKKLYKLNLKADVDVQKEYSKKHMKRAGLAMGVAGLGIGAGIANQIDIRNKLIKAASEIEAAKAAVKPPRSRKKIVVNEGKGVYKVGEGLNNVNNGQLIGQVGNNGSVGYKHPSSYSNQAITNTPGIGGTLYTQSGKVNPADSIYRKRKNAAEIVALAGLGTAAYQTGKAIAAKYRTTAKGHAKAIAKRDAWKQEMNAAFKGTYVNQNKKKKHRG